MGWNNEVIISPPDNDVGGWIFFFCCSITIGQGLLPHKLCLRPSMFEFVRFLKSEVITDVKMLGSLCFKVQMEYKKYI